MGSITQKSLSVLLLLNFIFLFTPLHPMSFLLGLACAIVPSSHYMKKNQVRNAFGHFLFFQSGLECVIVGLSRLFLFG